MTNPHDLKGLSEEATAGKWSVEKHGGAVCVTDGHSCLAHDPSPHDAAFIVALVNAFRSGSLVPVERVRELEKAAANLNKALRPFLFLFERDEFGREDDQLDGLPDAHGFEVVWETDDMDKAPIITVGQVKRAREAVAALQALKGDT